MNKWRNRGTEAMEQTREERSENMKGTGKVSHPDIVKP